jgi:hypothetical protein
MGFEPTIPVFERPKTVHALDRAATVIGFKDLLQKNWSYSTVPMVLQRSVMTVEVLGLLCDVVRNS